MVLRQYTAARPSRVPLLAILSRMISGCLVVVYRQLEFGSGWSLNQHFFGPCDLILMVRLALRDILKGTSVLGIVSLAKGDHHKIGE